MKAILTEPKAASTILPGADFADAWRVADLPIGLDAPTITARVFGNTPRWLAVLLTIRNAIVAPFGLKTGIPGEYPEIGGLAFPVVSSQPRQVVLGFDDAHLDFRVVIDVVAAGKGALAATATTYVRTHNVGGRVYLGLVKPFHRFIVPAMLKRAATAS